MAGKDDREFAQVGGKNTNQTLRAKYCFASFIHRLSDWNKTEYNPYSGRIKSTNANIYPTTGESKSKR